MPRKFLVVADDSAEFRAALSYAARRARSTGGRVALLKVLEPSTNDYFAGVREEIEAELRRNAETTATAFENQLDALYSAEAMDISTDIEVLDSILKSQNLAK